MELESYLRYLATLVFVLALIGLAAWVLKRLGLAGAGVARAGRPRRVRIVEVTPLDARRRLVLVRRDEVEHLLLLGASSELVVERGITPDAPPRRTAMAGDETP